MLIGRKIKCLYLVEKYLNTSNVNVNLKLKLMEQAKHLNLNTSNVNVNLIQFITFKLRFPI